MAPWEDLYSLLIFQLGRDAIWDYQLLHYVLLFALGTAVLAFRWGRGSERIVRAGVAWLAIPGMWVTLLGTRPVADAALALLRGMPLTAVPGHREAALFVLVATGITIWSWTNWPGTRRHIPEWAGAALALLASLYSRAAF